MKSLSFLAMLLLTTRISFAQPGNTDSLINALTSTSGNEQQIAILKQLSDQQNSAPVIIKYGQQGVALAKRLQLPYEQEYFLADLGRGYHKNDDYPKMLETGLTGLRLSQQLNDEFQASGFAMAILIGYDQGGDYENAIRYGMMGLQMAEKIKNPLRMAQLNDYVALHYLNTRRFDSALLFERRSNQVATADHNPNVGFSLYGLGVIHEKMLHYDSALFYYNKAVPAFKASNTLRTENLVKAYTGMASVYKSNAKFDSALYFADIAYKLTQQENRFQGTYETASLLSALYEGKNDKECLYYYKIAAAAKDSLVNADKTKQMLMLSNREQRRQQDLIDALEKRRNQLFWAIGILVSLFILIYYYRRYRFKNQLEIEKIRSNIAADFHDDLGATLSSIALYTEIACGDDLTIMKRTKNILSLIGQSSRGTISAMQDMIWSIQPNRDTMKDLIDRMREYAYPLAELKNIKLIFTIEKEVQNLTISMENRKNIYLIFKEAVNNAFKYSSAANIAVAIGRQQQRINLEIKDDGTGFDKTKISKGNGLGNMRKRAAQAGGTLDIRSDEQTGTSILFTGLSANHIYE